MPGPHRLLAVLTVCVTVGALLAAGCGGDDDGDAGAGSAAGSVATSAATTALAIEERVVEGDLGGYQPGGPPQVTRTPEEFFQLAGAPVPAKQAAAFRRAGFVEGAVRLYLNTSGPGFSAAAQLGSPQQARAEADRIGDQFASGVPPGTSEKPLPGVPGSRTVVSNDLDALGQGVHTASAIFTDGPFLYITVAGGRAEDLDPHAVLDAAAALYEKVEGSPPA